MKIKDHIKIVFTLAVLFLLLPILVFFVSVVFSLFGKYEIALQIDEMLLGIFPQNRVLLEKIGNDFYKKGDFTSAIQTYEKIPCEKEKSCARIFHNTGNAFFGQAEKSSQDSSKIFFYQKSLNAYLQALEIKNDPETQQNYNIVLEKLNRLLNKQTSQQPQNELGESPSGQEQLGAGELSSPQEENSQGEETQEPLETSSQNNGLGGEESQAENALGEEELQEIEQKRDELLQYDIRNRHYNNSQKIPLFSPFGQENDW